MHLNNYAYKTVTYYDGVSIRKSITDLRVTSSGNVRT